MLNAKNMTFFCLRDGEIGSQKNWEGKIRTACQKQILSLSCVYLQVCVCVCVWGFRVDVCLWSVAETGFTPAEEFFPRHSEICHLHSSASPCLSLGVKFPMIFFFRPSTRLLSFLNFHINLFLTSALAFRAHIPSPQRCALFFSFYNPSLFFFTSSLALLMQHSLL